MNSDPYADLSDLCGITAFSLPSRPSTDHHTTVADHLLSRYLCYDPQPPPSATTIHPPLLDPPDLTPHDSPLFHESLPDSPASLVRQPEILPPCVVNYQDSLYFTPEREASASLGDYENWLPSRINETALCDPNDVLAEHMVSVIKDFAFTDGNSKRLLSHIKKLALWHKYVIFDDKDCKDIVSFMTSFRYSAFSTHARKNSLQEPSRKKPRKHDAKSNNKDSASTGGYGKRLPSHIKKKLALWHKDVTFMTSFSDFAFSSHGRKNSRKKQRKHEAQSQGVPSSFHYSTRSKSANRLF